MPYKDPERQREYQREWRARRHDDWFADKRCLDCGAVDRLEIDHLDPTEKVDHRIWSWSEERRVVELAKCVVRCHDCHWQKSLEAGDFGGTSPHGSSNRYNKYKCRCRACKSAEVLRVSDRRRRRNNP